MGRFINADALVSTGQGLLGNNMFAYCMNNSVRYVDISGYYATADDVRAMLKKLFLSREQEICAILGRKISLDEVNAAYKV